MCSPPYPLQTRINRSPSPPQPHKHVGMILSLPGLPSFLPHTLPRSTTSPCGNCRLFLPARAHLPQKLIRDICFWLEEITCYRDTHTHHTPTPAPT
ncbi:unnamed protein product [Tuber melanosporum]|uniref:(Perigord truffle) hypothetical protein n=1 Tax=Tuber melanosporum (strain Mel28) TaxID=656061 RepID=D5GGW6_TUBMM|nr:uncharacterized protein GSTUM_00007553001 [Tuber melanosporum]CAZ83759.1 unnamed protein product [Tuber melanosporum]